MPAGLERELRRDLEESSHVLQSETRSSMIHDLTRSTENFFIFNIDIVSPPPFILPLYPPPLIEKVV
jgi:hypothetical protein